MQLKKLILSALALTFVSLGVANAQVEIRITGATAFRSSALQALLNRFQNASVPDFRYAHSGSSFTGSTYAVFKGNFPGVTGTVTVRTSFNGSVQGIRALVQSPAQDPSYLGDAVLPGTSSAAGVVAANVTTSGNLTAMASDLAFSDVNIASTPYAASAASLEPSSAEVGVVVFTMLANEGAPSNLTNVTDKQFEVLFGSGLEELSLLTGSAADNGKPVFASGRNDGSGTRTTYLAETGIGVSTLVQQYTGTVSLGFITSLRITGPNNQPSTVWSQNVLGNGGYESGGSLRALFENPSAANVDVYFTDAGGTPTVYNSPVLITWLSVGDAATAVTNGAKALNFNGVGITPADPLSASDVEKIAYGQYTGWGYQQLYRISGLSSDQLTVDNALRSFISGFLGGAGLPTSTMQSSRAVDGGFVGSL